MLHTGARQITPPPSTCSTQMGSSGDRFMDQRLKTYSSRRLKPWWRRGEQRMTWKAWRRPGSISKMASTSLHRKPLMRRVRDLGTLADEKWRHLPWQMPPDEASRCWSQRVKHMHRHYLACERYARRSTDGSRLVLASLVGLPTLLFQKVPRERFRARQK